MIERSTAELFIGRNVILILHDDEAYKFKRGRITAVTDSSICLDFQGMMQAYSLSYIEGIREDRGGGWR